MIKLIQNAMTIKKGSLNFMDQNGKVIGFNPRPDGNPLSFFVYTPSGEALDTHGRFIEDYLDGLPYSFGKDGRIVKHDLASEADDTLIISLVPDGENEPLVLHIVCLNSLYYTADFTLTDEDRLAFRKAPPRPDVEGAARIAELNHIMTELLHIREQASQALADLDHLKKRLAATSSKN